MLHFRLLFLTILILISPASLLAQITIKYSEKFTLEQDDYGWIMTVREPYKGSPEVLKTRLIQKGKTAPEEDFPKIELPIKKVISLSTVNLPHLVVLNKLSTLIGVDNFKYINTPEVREVIDQNKLSEVGEFQNLNIEKVLELCPELVLTYTTGQAKYDTHHRLRKAGIQTLVLASYLESSPLGRAEWIKLFGLLFGEIELANKTFEGIEQRYLNMKKLAQGIQQKPKVFCNAPFGDTWYMPGGDSYKAKLIADAGGDYLWHSNKETGALPLAFEKVFEIAINADIWLVSSHLPWNNYEDVLKSDTRYKHFKAFKDHRLISNDKRRNPQGGNDIYEAGTLNPDLILKDFIQIFHPQLLKDSSLYFHRPLQVKN